MKIWGKNNPIISRSKSEMLMKIFKFGKFQPVQLVKNGMNFYQKNWAKIIFSYSKLIFL